MNAINFSITNVMASRSNSQQLNVTKSPFTSPSERMIAYVLGDLTSGFKTERKNWPLLPSVGRVCNVITRFSFSFHFLK